MLDSKFSQDCGVKISIDSRESRYKISICKTHESHYEICCETREKRALLQNFSLRDSQEAMQNVNSEAKRKWNEAKTKRKRSENWRHFCFEAKWSETKAKFFRFDAKKVLFRLFSHLKCNKNEMKRKGNEKEAKTSKRKRIKWNPRIICKEMKKNIKDCGEPAISHDSHHVSLVQGTTCLLPATRDTGSNPQGGTYLKPGFSC